MAFQMKTHLTETRYPRSRNIQVLGTPQVIIKKIGPSSTVISFLTRVRCNKRSRSQSFGHTSSETQHDATAEGSLTKQESQARKGRWTKAEETFAAVLVEQFNGGILDECHMPKEKETMSTFVARMLQCKRTRVSKKAVCYEYKETKKKPYVDQRGKFSDVALQKADSELKRAEEAFRTSERNMCDTWENDNTVRDAGNID